MADHITDKAVTAMRKAADEYYEHDCTRDDECCYRRPDWLGALSAGLAAALPVLNTTKDAETAVLEVIDERDGAEEWADRLAYAIAGIAEIGEHSSTNNPWERALAEAAELHATNERMRQRLFELGPIVDTLTHGGVAAVIARLRKENAELRAGYPDTCDEPMPVEGNAEEAQTCDYPAVPGTTRCPIHDPRHQRYIDSLTDEIRHLRQLHDERDRIERTRTKDAEITALRNALHAVLNLVEPPSRANYSMSSEDADQAVTIIETALRGEQG